MMQAKSQLVILHFLAVIMIRGSQAVCPSRSDQLQMRAEVTRANDGVTFRGVGVFWTFGEDYRNCSSLAALRVRISPPFSDDRRDYIDITYSDNSADFINLDCNKLYLFSISFSYSLGSFYLGMRTSVFYGGPMSVPSKIPQVFAGSDALDPKARLSISWDPLPCHLQNGTDISDYIIQYRLATITVNETQTISVFDDRLDCIKEPVGGPYRCYLTNTLFLEDQIYILRVAAVNSYGIGPYSDPINATLYSQEITNSTKSGEVRFNVDLEPPQVVIDMIVAVNTSLNAEITNSTKSDEVCFNIDVEPSQVVIAWMVGSQVVGVTVLLVVGVLIIVLIIVTLLLWKRMTLISQGTQLQHHRSDQIRMTECLAYGEISSTPRGATS